MKQSIRNNEGFSVVEILIAMGILAIGIMAVVKLFPSGLGFARVAQEKSVATETAASNLSRLRMTGASNLLGISQSTAMYGDVSGRLDGASDNKVVGNYSASVRRIGESDDQALVRVTFSVDTPGGRRENFVTYMADY